VLLWRNASLSFWIQSLLKDVISLLCFSLTWLRGGFRSVQGVRILVYHTVQEIPPHQDPLRLSVPPELLRAHLEYLRKLGFVVVPLTAVLDHVRGRKGLSAKSVALTFDDGYAEQFSVVRPMLQEFGVPATFFVICRAIKTGGTIDGLQADPSRRRSMTVDQVRSLAERGIEIGSHSVNHVPLSGLDDSCISQEVLGSKLYLEENLGKSVATFAYPFGSHGTFNETTRKELQAAGYDGACVNLLGWNRPGDDPFTLRRTRIGWDDRPWRFILKLFGAYDWIDRYWIRVGRPSPGVQP